MTSETQGVNRQVDLPPTRTRNEPATEAGRGLMEWLSVAPSRTGYSIIVAGQIRQRILAIEAEARDAALREQTRITPIDESVLYAVILDELVELWGEPSDDVSRAVRPQVARSIVNRYVVALPHDSTPGEPE